MLPRIISRYVFRQAAGAFLLILLSLAGVVWIALALRQLNVVTSQGQDTLMLLKMTTLALPNLMAIIAPFALLIATMHTLNRLNGDSELIVLTAAGGTVWSVARPLLLLGLLVSLGVGYVNHYANPWSLRLLREYIVQVRTDLLTQVIQPGRFSQPEANLTFHIRDRALSGELQGLLMHDARDPKLVQSYLADRGVIVKQDPAAYLVMYDGHILRREKPDEPPRVIIFDQYAVDLDRFEQKNEANDDLKPRERFYEELVRPDPNSAQFKHAPGQFRSELHERFSNPLFPLAFVMIALASVGQAQSTRQNRVERLVFGFVAAAGLRLAGMAVNNIVALKAGMVPVLYALPLGGIALAAIAIVVGARQRRGGPTLRDRVADAMAPALAFAARAGAWAVRRPLSRARA
jgi:lipopolysaccharide export system permease protein